MSERTRSLLFAGLLVALAAAMTVLIATDPTEEDRVARLGASIMCPVCQGEAIIHSPSQMARDMMGLVEERVGQGATNEQIIDELMAAYGSNILLDPPVSGPTLILWLTPILALAAGVGVILWWRRHPGVPPGEEVVSNTRGRRAAGALILIGSAAAVVIAVGFFLQERDDLGGGLADVDVASLDEVSNETMEAVIGANLDHPLVSGMRLALADRYLEEGDYRAAFPHYLGVAESQNATTSEKVAALAGLGWMTWDGNQQAETALGLFDRALTLDPNSIPVRFLKARVLACAGGPADAEAMLSEILEFTTLTEEWRRAVEEQLSAVRAGEGCR
jgi:cytochrome c-type biogenesis protein CcmH